MAIAGSFSEPVAEKGFVEFTLSGNEPQPGEAEHSVNAAAFKGSWDRLVMDRYMADGGEYRLRRHGVFEMDTSTKQLDRLPGRAHYQDVSYNPINGGIARYFEPIETTVAQSSCFLGAIRVGAEIATKLSGVEIWHVEAHQFRILASSDGGEPTPEGLHRDGVDYVLIVLIERENVTRGATFIADLLGREVFRRVLSKSGEAIFLDDEVVMHGVEPIFPVTSGEAAYRDSLVITYCRSDE